MYYNYPYNDSNLNIPSGPVFVNVNLYYGLSGVVNKAGYSGFNIIPITIIYSGNSVQRNARIGRK